MENTITKISGPEELKRLIDDMQGRKSENNTDKILICTGGGCIASGSLKVKEEFEKQINDRALSDKLTVVGTGCLGPCVCGPVVVLGKDKTFYQGVDPEDVTEIIEKHIIGGQSIERLMWSEGREETPVPVMTDLEYFKRQTKIVLRNCGTIDPYSIEDYFATGGYKSVAKALFELKPEGVLEEMKKSGLRGRGGAGFPTYMKWSFAAKNKSDQKYMLCNADEGDPGAFMDRSVLEGDPHSLIEGMIIGAFAIGASQGYVYVRAEYPLAVERLEKAIADAKEYGMLGENILGSGYSFDLEIRMGSGAFVCGEETALIASIEGKRGEPRPRPPFPTDAGLWGKPSCLNNVESYANVAAIIEHGGEWFAAYGTEKSKGTKVFALAGDINNAGLVEVHVGTTLGELIYDIGGGIPGNKRFKAAQIGGPSGGCIPKAHLNVPLDYESLNELGAIMGSGGLIVMDESSCMVDVARFFLEFVQEESCGKCVPCRVGTKRMLEILNRICDGKGEEGDIEKLEELGEQIRDTALCGLGQSAPNPVLSTLRYFRHEYEQHIRERHCEAGVCSGLVRAACQSACPAHVDVPGFLALTAEKRYAEALRLHRERNPFAAVCARVCFHKCEDSCRRISMDDSVAIRSVKRFMVDQEITVQLPEIRENEENAKRKVAIIGAGPAGLTCGYFLARLGYRPVVFEAEHRPGGMLVQTIPSYRLPREILAREIRMIEGMGVEIRTNHKLGLDFTIENLRDEGYECIFVGIGTAKGVCLDMPGVNAIGVTNAMEFLRTYNLRGSVPVGKKVIVVGGGNAAFDAARTAIRLGAETVTLVYRRAQSDMPAYAEEIEEAVQEGINIMPLTNPRKIIVEDGRVTGVRCNSMKLGEFDKSGRRRAINDETLFVLEADQVIQACGQAIEDPNIFRGIKPEVMGDWDLQVDPVTQQTAVPWIFSGGDCANTGENTVIEAIASGERAAVSIDEYLTGEKHAFWREDKYIPTKYNPDADPVEYPRKKLPLLALDRRRCNFAEVEQPWTEGEAIRQAERCLRCEFGK